VQQRPDALGLFVGEWSMTAGFDPIAPVAPIGRTTFSWLPGRRFLIQRWDIEYPDAPDGIAIIEFVPEQATYLQHYYDSRGVARVYEMMFANSVWTLLRVATEPDFSQRFTGTFSEDGNTIVGRWERSNDGLSWTPDFDLTYRRAR